MAPGTRGTALRAWSLPYKQLMPGFVALCRARLTGRHGAKRTTLPDAIVGFLDTKVGARHRGADAENIAGAEKGRAVAERPVDTSAIQVAKAWESATAPAKSLPMSLMMLWMSGNSVQIFSMMVVFMTVVNPLKSLATVHTVFAPYRSSKHSLAPQVAVFIACQLLCIALGLYKCWSMGLLPTESSDWLACP
ncbi:hypothetical protein MSPP1_001430 [Malassezia sp. CBS 17886]|nr:hypothetical protein MSPP1_001430 [Malassezia sp. CBS 17886]